MLGDGESQLWEVTRKSTVNKAKVVMQICPGLLIGSVGRLGTERETPLGMNILLTNVNVLLRRVTSPWISQLLPCLQLLKINPLKIISVPKEAQFGWQTQLPFEVLRDR